MNAPWQLTQDAQGRLVFTDAQGQSHHGVSVVRPFPISAPDYGVSILNAQGQEILWLSSGETVPTATRELLASTLAVKDFMPEIQRIVAVNSFATPSTWTVDTNRGPTQLTLKGEEDIRRLSNGMLLITDRDNVHFLIRSLPQLDHISRKFLDRFL